MAFITILLICGIAGTLDAQTSVQPGPDGDFLYAMQLKKDGYLDLAIQQFELFIQKYPQENRVPRALRLIAEGKFQLSDYAGARAAFERLLLRYPASPEAQDALYQIATCLVRLDSVQAAAMTYERFARIHPTAQLAPDALLHAASLYLKNGQVARARRILFDIPAQYPQNESAKARAQFTLLQSFYETGEFDRAFRAADAFLAQFSEVLATAQVWLIKARMHRMLKQFREALDSYETILQKYKNTPAYAPAVLESAELRFYLGDRETAFDWLTSLFNRDDSVRAAAVLKSAQFYLMDKQPAQALNLLQNHRALLQNNASYWAVWARAHARLKNASEVLNGYRKAAALLPDGADSLKAMYLLRAGRAALQLQEATALRSILSELADFAELPVPLHAAVVYLKAQFSDSLLHDYPKAIRLYEQYSDHFPNSPLVDDALAAQAMAYEKLRAWHLAVAEWKKLQQLYPGSPWADRAGQRIQRIQRYFLTDLAETADLIARLPLDLQNHTDTPAKLISADIFMQFRRYDSAISIFKQIAAENPAANIRNRALLGLADAYYAMGEKNWLAGQPSAVSWFDSARVLYHYLRKKVTDENQRRKIDVRLAAIHLSAPDSTSSVFLDSLAQAYPQSPAFEEVHLYRLRRSLSQNAHLDSLELADLRENLQFWARHARRHPALAAQLLSRFYWAQRDTAAALETLKSTDKQTPSAEWIEAQFELTRLLQAAGQKSEAEKRLRVIADHFFYSSYADSALQRLVQLAHVSDEPQKVLQYIQSYQQRLAWHVGMTEGSLPRTIQILFANALQKINQPLKAAAAYLDFLHQTPNKDDTALQALMALAELATQLNTPHLARKYYQEIIRNFSGHPQSMEAKLLLAELEFKEQNFRMARMLALEVVRSVREDADQKRRAARLAIISGLRMGQMNAVLSEMKNYETQFPEDRETLAEIQFELGDFHLRQKNFKKAEDVFKALRKKFKNSSYAIRGDFGLGKAYLIQNKTDDALEVLTDIPKKYPGHPFLRVVYLNLGDFYQAQQQWANAIGAFKKVLEDSVYDRHAKIAMRSLINLYERQGYVDVALKYTREYLSLFPNDEFSFNLKIKIGSFLRRLGQFQEAIAQYRQLLPLADGDAAAEIQFYIGETYFESGQFEKAIVEYLRLKYIRIRTKFPWRTTAVYKAGICYMRLQQYRKARELFEWVLRMEGSGSIFGKSAQEKIREIDRQLSQLTSVKEE